MHDPCLHPAVGRQSSQASYLELLRCQLAKQHAIDGMMHKAAAVLIHANVGNPVCNLQQWDD
jgi:hypothetical protein